MAQDTELRQQVKLLQQATQRYLSRNRMTIPMLARKINLSTSLVRSVLNYHQRPAIHWLIRIAEAIEHDPLPLVIAHLKIEIGEELVNRLAIQQQPLDTSGEEGI